MSFDSEFDYTAVTTYLNGRISELTVEKNETSNCLAIIANLTAQYDDISSDENTYLTNKHVILTKNIGRLGNIINKVITVQNLPSESKNVIYDFYTTYVSHKPNVIDKKVYFMRQIVSHTDVMLPHMGNIINDGNIDSSTGNYLSDLLCRKYEPLSETSSFTLKLLKDFNA